MWTMNEVCSFSLWITVAQASLVLATTIFILKKKQKRTQVPTKFTVRLYQWMNHLGPKFNFYFYNYFIIIKSHYASDTTLDIGNKNYFDGRVNNWYVLGPSSIFFCPIAALWNSLKLNVIQQIKNWPYLKINTKLFWNVLMIPINSVHI